MRWIRRLTLTLALALALAALGFTQESPAEQEAAPQLYVFSGAVTASGGPANDGFVIVAKVGDYTSEPVTVVGGRYHQLKVLPGPAYNGQLITFWTGSFQASQVGGRYSQPGVIGIPVILTVDLDFPGVPGDYVAIQPGPGQTAVPTPGGPGPTAGPVPTVPTGIINLPDVGGSAPSPLWVMVLVGVGVGAVAAGVGAMRLAGTKRS